MPSISIQGPARIEGEIEVRGAKNAALPTLIAAAAGDQTVILENTPSELRDIQTTIEALRHIGHQVTVSGSTVTVYPTEKTVTGLPSDISSRFRYSLLFLGLLVGKHKHAVISAPGGCNLGDRKYDLHLHGLKKLGAEITCSNTSIEISAPRLIGTDIEFYLPTTTGTETIMLAACFAEGRTRIFNANTRPEIADMAACLNSMGAKISVKNRVVEIEGGRPLGGCTHKIMSGWDEALTYILAAGITGGEICVRHFSAQYIRNDIEYLRAAGMDVFEWGGNIYASGKNKQLKAFDLFTAPYQGINSDMQPLYAVLASRCQGESTITDQRFTERFQYVRELQKFNIPISSYGNCAVIAGNNTKLTAAHATALDLRCGAALVLAALAAEGTSVISNCQQIERGYELITERLTSLKVQAQRIEND